MEKIIGWVIIVVFIGLILAGGIVACGKVVVYTAELSGKAEYVKAEQNRKIAILEADALLESSKLQNQADIERAKGFAESEVIRARGVAESNEIIGSGLKGNKEYLQYLHIDALKTTQNRIIYVPTEAGLPILEAGQR